MKKKKQGSPKTNNLLSLREFLRPDCSILDVGANIGQFFIAIKKIFPNSTVVSVEPNPRCEIHLKNTNTEYHICGLGSEKTFLNLILPKNKKTSKGASYYPANWLTSESASIITTPVYPADELFKNRKFDLIKIDTQGFELEVLKGSIELLKNTTVLIIECNILAENIGAPHWSKILEFLEPFGFYAHDVFDERTNNDSKVFQVDCVFTKTIKSHHPSIFKYL